MSYPMLTQPLPWVVFLLAVYAGGWIVRRAAAAPPVRRALAGRVMNAALVLLVVITLADLLLHP